MICHAFLAYVFSDPTHLGWDSNLQFFVYKTNTLPLSQQAGLKNSLSGNRTVLQHINHNMSVNILIETTWPETQHFLVSFSIISTVCSLWENKGGVRRGIVRGEKATLTSLSSLELILCLPWILRGAGRGTESGFMLAYYNVPHTKSHFISREGWENGLKGTFALISNDTIRLWVI